MLSLDEIRAQWQEFSTSLKGLGKHGNLDALVRTACEPVAVEGNTLTLGFYYAFHKERIEEPQYRHLLEQQLVNFFGVPYRIQCVLVSKFEERTPAAQGEETERPPVLEHEPAKAERPPSVTRLRWAKMRTSDTFADGRVRLHIQFMDEKGNLYDWTPKWKDVNDLFVKASTTEVFNKPGSEWVKQFAQTSKEVFERYAGIKDAYLVKGWLSSIRGGKLVLHAPERVWQFDPESGEAFPSVQPGEVLGAYPVAFDLTEEWLSGHLQTWVSCLVINGVVVKVTAEN